MGAFPDIFFCIPDMFVESRTIGISSIIEAENMIVLFAFSVTFSGTDVYFFVLDIFFRDGGLEYYHISNRTITIQKYQALSL